jgi:uncharacterized protein YkwD
VARILNFNSSGKMSEKNIFKKIWNLFGSQDKFFKFSVIALLLIAIATPFITNNLLDIRQRASGGDCTVSDTDNSLDSEEARLLELINQHRQQNGKLPVTILASGQKSATWKAKDMADITSLRSIDSLGRSVADRMRDCGASSQFYDFAQGAGFTTADTVFDVMKNSPVLNSRMLHSSMTNVGIARHYNAASDYDWYWEADFSSQPIATLTPTATPDLSRTTDSDGDGFTNYAETFMGTDPNKKCATSQGQNNEPEPDAWPLDFDDNKRANTIDAGRYTLAGVLNSVRGDSKYRPRFDLNQDDKVDLADINILRASINTTCI